MPIASLTRGRRSLRVVSAVSHINCSKIVICLGHTQIDTIFWSLKNLRFWWSKQELCWVYFGISSTLLIFISSEFCLLCMLQGLSVIREYLYSQLYHTTPHYRMGLMVLGNADVGKTSVILSLMDTSKLKLRDKYKHSNPSGLKQSNFSLKPRGAPHEVC